MKFCVIPCCIKPRSTPKKHNVSSVSSKCIKRSSIDFTSDSTISVFPTSSVVSSKYYFLTNLNLSSTLKFINLSAVFSSSNIIVISDKLETCEHLSATTKLHNKDTISDRIFQDIQHTYCFCTENELDYLLTKNQVDTIVVM